MAQQQYTLFKKFIGYGHYKLIIADKEGTRMEAVTGDMDLISRLSSELEEEREKATKEAIKLCVAGIVKNIVSLCVIMLVK